MGAIVGGLGAAVFWAAGTLCSSRASRQIGAGPALALIMVVGLALIAPFVVLSDVPDELNGSPLAWLILAGVANLVGLACIFSAFRLGKVSIIAPIASAEGAFAAVIAVAAGEHLAALEAAALVVIVAGIALAAAHRNTPDDGHTHTGMATLFSVLAAATFGFTLYATAQASDDLPVPWVLLPARLLGTLVIAVPLALRSRLRLTREAAPLVLAAGVCEVLGLTSFAIGSRDGVAVTAVISSQFAALSALAAFFLFRERLARPQLIGVIATVAGVACLGALQA